jgi:hypothetical protein
MNNKKGGVGAKILLVLILMIASAVGGAYGYRVLDGKMAVREAIKDLENIRVTDYDTEETSTLEGLIDTAKKDLETASTRKEVYEIIGDFTIDASKIKTRTEKELEEARREAEEARNSNRNNNNSNSSNNYNDYSDDSGNYNSSDDYNSNSSNGNYDSDNTNSNSGSGSNDAITNDDGSSGRSSILGGLFGSNNDDN